MTDDARHPASSDRYTRPSWIERAGIRVGALIGEGRVRRVLRRVFRQLLELAGGRNLRSTLPGGEVIRIAAEYRYITWNPAEYVAFRAVLRPGDTAIDVGANVGAYAILFGLWVGETGCVVAFEPGAEAFAGLQRHIALNGLERCVRAVQSAVSDRVGTAPFVSEGAQGTNRLTEGGASAGAPVVQVATTTIDTMCAAGHLRPRLIKIDVEGAELAVLRGARRTIAEMPTDGAVFVELHPAAWPVMGHSREDLIAEFTAQRLRPVALRSGTSPWDLEGECVRLERV